MCGPVSGGGSMPPMKPATLPTPGEPATKAGGATDVAGASGGGEATAAAAMPANLTSVLQQLVDAVKLLGQALGRGTAGGGGPIQAPTQMPPMKLGGPGHSTGGGEVSPVDFLDRRLEQLLTRTDLSSTARASLTSLKSGLMVQARADAQRYGTFNPIQLARISMTMNIAEVSGDPARRSALEALMPRVDAMEAESDRTGTFDPIALQRFDADVRAIMTGVTPPLP